MRMLRSFLTVYLSLVISACNLLDNPTVPEGTLSPTMYHTKTGGLGMSEYTYYLFSGGVSNAIQMGGLLSDELNVDFSKSNEGEIRIDERYLPEPFTPTTNVGSSRATITYIDLHELRGQASLARAVLEEFGDDVSPAVIGRLMAIEGYSVIYLADLFCSGVPLSTVDFEGDYTYEKPSSTEELYLSAVKLFDSAIKLSANSLSVVSLAKTGKARALLEAGKYDEAYHVTQEIATDEAYIVVMKRSFTASSDEPLPFFSNVSNVSDREGQNGLPFRSALDPRVPLASMQSINAPLRGVIYFPVKYSTFEATPFIVSSGIEARLIEAEYHLSKNDLTSMLSVLNALRTDGTYIRIDTLPDGSRDTVWKAGTGGVDQLSLLAMPPNPDSALTLLFNERAYWLFLTGHRLPDLRRLVRLYGREQYDVFPTGLYTASDQSMFGEYQSDINLPIPYTERVNPHFRGCLSRDQ